MMDTFLRAAAAAILLLAAGGCVSQPRIEKLYQDPDAGKAPYERLLVIGVAGDAAQRRDIEELLAGRLIAGEVAAIASYTRLGTSPVVLQEAVDEAARDSGADAILIAHMVSASVTPEYREERVDVRSECRGGSPVDLFLYDYKELREPASVTFAHEVTMVTNLYDAATGNRIWTIQSTCFEKTEFEAVLQREAEAIVRQLRRDGLIAPTRSSG